MTAIATGPARKIWGATGGRAVGAATDAGKDFAQDRWDGLKDRVKRGFSGGGGPPKSRPPRQKRMGMSQVPNKSVIKARK